MNNTNLRIVGYSLLVLSIGLAIAWGGLAYFSAKKANEPKACTMEAKECPDGSYVGRDSGNNCEFSPCPLEK
jgi:hypothetical protein